MILFPILVIGIIGLIASLAGNWVLAGATVVAEVVSLFLLVGRRHDNSED